MRPTKLGKQAADHIRREILEGRLKPGDNLPGEGELMPLFGISRPTLREAMRILESLGLIVVYRGKKGGAEVRLPTIAVTAANAAIYLQSKRASFFDLQQARTCIEPTLVTLLEGRIKKADLKTLRSILGKAAEAIDSPAKYAEAITNFHAALFGLLGNKVLNLIAGILHSMYQPLVRRHLESYADAVRNNHLRQNVKSQHHLLDLMEKGKFVEAGEYCRENLIRIGNILLETGGVTRMIDSQESYERDKGPSQKRMARRGNGAPLNRPSKRRVTKYQALSKRASAAR